VGKSTRWIMLDALPPTVSAHAEFVICDCAIENRLHYVRDVTMGEDASQIRTGSAPQVMAALRNVVLAPLRTAGFQNMAGALREIGWSGGALLFLGLST
jgi:hypothetical protein